MKNFLKAWNFVLKLNQEGIEIGAIRNRTFCLCYLRSRDILQYKEDIAKRKYAVTIYVVNNNCLAIFYIRQCKSKQIIKILKFRTRDMVDSWACSIGFGFWY